MLRNSIVVLFVMLSVGLPAIAQATQPVEKGPAAESAVAPGAPAVLPAAAPSDTEWPKIVAAFAKSLAAGDALDVEAALTARASLRRFDGEAVNDATQISRRLAKSTVIGHHAYLHPPLVMAADIAADFKNAVGIPDKAKERFLVDDEHEIQRANATAVQWVVEQLTVRGGTPIGIIVLWTPRPGPPGAAATESAGYEVTFVLCRGDEVEPHEFKINAVVYGVPVAEQNP